MPEQTGPQPIQDNRDVYKLDSQPVLAGIEISRARAHATEGQEEMHSVGVRRRVRVQAGDQFPSLRSKSGFLFELPTCRPLNAGVLRVNGASRQLERAIAYCMAVLPDQDQGAGAS